MYVSIRKHIWEVFPYILQGERGAGFAIIGDEDHRRWQGRNLLMLFQSADPVPIETTNMHIYGLLWGRFHACVLVSLACEFFRFVNVMCVGFLLESGLPRDGEEAFDCNRDLQVAWSWWRDAADPLE
jgi:hypothetical protein